MCERYIIIEPAETLEERFFSKIDHTQYKINYNLSVGQYAPVIANTDKSVIQFFQFGLTPFWANKPMYLFNARAEGDLNKDDDPNFSGAKQITEKASFRKPISTQRCLVLASGFIDGPDRQGLNKPYLIYLKDASLFAMAGIYDIWKDPVKGELLKSFSIITTTANDLLRKIKQHRMPVILNPDEEQKWLSNEISLREITGLLKSYPPELMDAYPISPEIKNYKINHKDAIKPLGNNIAQVKETKMLSHLITGRHQSPSHD